MKGKLSVLLLALLLLCSCQSQTNPPGTQAQADATDWQRAEESEKSTPESESQQAEPAVVPVGIPEYAGEPFAELNGNVPDFAEAGNEAFETYSELDELGRCGVAYANVGLELMPTEDRESISRVKPTGWVNNKYDFIDGQYLYNRCHLIGFQLTAENANDRNLITGTRYFNVEGMLPFENMVADYIKETGNHVLYRVTPMYDGDDLVARGVQMEAKSVEDDGEGILFNVFVFNVQPGVSINYSTGENWEEAADAGSDTATFILNTKSKKFHRDDCPSVSAIAAGNKEEYTGSREALIRQGYSPCKSCNP